MCRLDFGEQMTQAIIERYFGEQCLIPALQAVGKSRQLVARTGMLPHHENYFEIHLILDGTVDWWVVDEIHTLKPGSVYVTKPGEPHGSVKNLVQPSRLIWLQVDGEALADQSIHEELWRLKKRSWLGANELIGLVQPILQEIKRPFSDSPRLVSAYLALFLARLLRQAANNEQAPIYPSQFNQLLAYIEQHLTAVPTITVEDLCEHSSLSRSRIFQLFEQHVGQSPISYVNTKRIELAKTILQDSSKPITDIGLELGYSSSQHFATVFRRKTGLSPSAYRQSATAFVDPEWRQNGRLHQLGHRDV